MQVAAIKKRIAANAAAQYRPSGRFAYHFAKGKLSHDPIFAAILAHALIPSRSRILDLGCGQGLLASWLIAAGQCRQSNAWCPEWAEPPNEWVYRGIEVMPKEVFRAQRALMQKASVECNDIRSAVFGAADVVVILDVLHYMNVESQESVLRQARAALSTSGVLLLRVGDANAGWRFRFSQWVDRLVLLSRGHGWVRLYCRSIESWMTLLEKYGFTSTTVPTNNGMPFANVLILATLQ